MADNTRDITRPGGYPEPQYDQGPIGKIASRATSRRAFIKGVIASGAAVSSAGYLFTLGGCSREGASVGGVERLLTLNVNGQMRPVDVLPNETLAMTLRYKLGLTGTKLGCDRGECGACTVLVDDVVDVLLLDVDARGARPRRRPRSKASKALTVSCIPCSKR